MRCATCVYEWRWHSARDLTDNGGPYGHPPLLSIISQTPTAIIARQAALLYIAGYELLQAASRTGDCTGTLR